ncbi:hypothetical protein IP69_19680 [Bosea sp. AAP35]|nr:hypothetical protein IP69_19680 [Bosea sp. AAP35]
MTLARHEPDRIVARRHHAERDRQNGKPLPVRGIEANLADRLVVDQHEKSGPFRQVGDCVAIRDTEGIRPQRLGLRQEERALIAGQFASQDQPVVQEGQRPEISFADRLGGKEDRLRPWRLPALEGLGRRSVDQSDEGSRAHQRAQSKKHRKSPSCRGASGGRRPRDVPEACGLGQSGQPLTRRAHRRHDRLVGVDRVDRRRRRKRRRRDR